jgi:release factor glutamine methyltransferase
LTTIRDLLSWAEQILAHSGTPSPRVNAEWILTEILSCSRPALYLHAQKSVSESQTRRYQSLIQRRALRIPLQHLLGKTEFFGLPFTTSPSALIPRPETETLINQVLPCLQNHPSPHILDVGTGSGIIAVTLSHELPKAQVLATDISLPALQLAKHNAARNGVSNRISFIQSDLLSALNPKAQFHAIVSNPPYISTGNIDGLDPEVRDHDPHLALDGGIDGLFFYRLLIPQSIPHLKPNGFLIFEIGHDQADTVSALIAQYPAFHLPTVEKDLSGYPRVVKTQKRVDR